MYWSEYEDEFLKSNYYELGGVETAKRLNRSVQSVRHRAHQFGIKSQFQANWRQYSHNDWFFSTPNILNCYWAGFIAADGYIGNKNTLGVTLASKDGNHLTLLANAINFTGPLRTNKKGQRVFNLCGCKRIIHDLETIFNITQRKSLTLKPPSLHDLSLQLAFIKGCIDGDGCIRYDNERLTLTIVGTSYILEWIKSIFCIINQSCKNKPNVIKPKNGNYYMYSLSGKKLLPIMQKLQDIQTPCLNRKWDKVITALAA